MLILVISYKSWYWSLIGSSRCPELVVLHLSEMSSDKGTIEVDMRSYNHPSYLITVCIFVICNTVMILASQYQILSTNMNFLNRSLLLIPD